MKKLIPIVAIDSVLLSLLSMYLTDAYLSQRIPIMGDFIGLQKTYNTGIAFGINFPPVLQGMLIGVAVLFAVHMAWCATTRWSQVAFGLILGGAIGNIIDRFIDGKVTDMIQVGTFPIFNIADSCITVGVVIVVAEMVFKRN